MKKEKKTKENKFKKELNEEKKSLKANLKNMKKSKLVISILKFVLLLVILIGIPAYLLIYQKEALHSFKTIDDAVKFLRSYNTQSILVYLGLQIIQIVISVIPGQIFQFAAGCIWGFAIGLVLSLFGAFLGSTIAFYIARFLGKDALHLFFSEEKLDYFVDRLNSKKAYLIVFLIYLIPGLPKDIMSYAAGVSEMKYKPFMILSLIGRIPGMSGSLMIGALYYTHHYVIMWIIAVIALAIFIVCFIKREALKKYIDKFYDKISE